MDFRISEADLRELLTYKAILVALANKDVSHMPFFKEAITEFLSFHNVQSIPDFVDNQIKQMKEA